MIREDTTWATGSFPLVLTPQGLDDTAGATHRAELAAGKCQHSWADLPKRYVFAHSEDTYRGHRCVREVEHRGACRCRYCGRERTGL